MTCLTCAHRFCAVQPNFIEFRLRKAPMLPEASPLGGLTCPLGPGASGAQKLKPHGGSRVDPVDRGHLPSQRLSATARASPQKVWMAFNGRCCYASPHACHTPGFGDKTPFSAASNKLGALGQSHKSLLRNATSLCFL